MSQIWKKVFETYGISKIPPYHMSSWVAQINAVRRRLDNGKINIKRNEILTPFLQHETLLGCQKFCVKRFLNLQFARILQLSDSC